MSELPDRISEVPKVTQCPAAELPVDSQRTASYEGRPSLGKRLALIFFFLLVVSGMLILTPQLAQQIAYSWNIGVERARVKVAKEFLAKNPLVAAEQRIAWVAKAVAPSVVGVYAITSPPGTRERDEASGFEDGIGSGVIVDAQGYILTNEHVIANAQVILVRLSDGRSVEAVKVGQDRSADLAVLQIDTDEIEAVPWGDSRHAIVGEQVVAIGNPYELQQTVTSGIISATERYGTTLLMGGKRRGRQSPQEFLQTDAAINPGNSGGALVDMNGKLIGICTAMYSQNGSNSGIGFAIPSFVAKRIYDEIVSQGKIQHGWLGVDYGSVTALQSRRMNQKKPMGAVIMRVRSRSPATKADLRQGDIILRWGETEINDPLQLSHVVLLSKPGVKETVEIFREGEFLTVDVVVGVRPTEFSAP